ncbi:hypothetical protein Tco_0654351 [Tanacetum coccineum]|uniref:Reverse transcriptase domain-containing protein n=1 Tax=Tanacetum coccineum TaxID=301880 RepID=A0ABQ4X2Z0_9ASTR
MGCSDLNKKKKFLGLFKGFIFGTTPTDDMFTAKKPLISSQLAIMDPLGDIMVRTTPLRKSLIPVSIGRQFIEMPMTHGELVMWTYRNVSRQNLAKSMKMHSKCNFKYAKTLTCGASTLWDRSRLLEGTSTFLWPLTTCLNRSLPSSYRILNTRSYWALKHCNFDFKTVGDHRKVQMNELNELWDQAYENSLIYKEKTKKIHDSKIKNRVFNVGDRVLLFNSRLKIFSGKLKTHWTEPFTIAQVFPYGTVELSQTNRPNFKVNGHRLKHYLGGDIPPMVVPDLQTFPMDH